jgi:beta-1,4-N-acetylglucosaminyltransferase
MIFVTVGNATQGFRRLLDAIDRLAGEAFWGDEEILIQYGNNPDFRAVHCRQEDFLPMDRFVDLIDKASLVVSHAGAGTILHALQAGKVPVIMPRRKQYGEVIDDHQLELVQALASAKRIVPAYEPDDLAQAVVEARRYTRPCFPLPSRMLGLVGRSIGELIAAGNRR